MTGIYTSIAVAASALVAPGSIIQEAQPEQLDYQIVENQATTPFLNPSMQKQQVAKIRLKNGVEAYLISDPDAKHSAVSVAVKVGSWNDPSQYAGMAHLVEHVLFMGSQAYPAENDFTQYIADCSGTMNAFTASDRTVYMCSVNHEGFEGALDRLAHFFIDPLLCTSSIERELHAVDQEHAKNLEHDGWRQWMILKEIGNPEHPNAGFSTGNASTLGGIPQDAMRTWFAHHYVPQNMRVVIVSPLPKEKLIEFVNQKFSLIQKNAIEIPRQSLAQKLFSQNQQGTLVAIKPIREMKELSLAWEISSSSGDHDTESNLDFLAYLLNSPHEGGLIDFLKEAKWIQDGKASYDRLGNEEILFSVNFTLTEEGIANKEQIIEKTFQAFELIKDGASEKQFDELKRLSLVHYQYQTRQNAFDLVQSYGQKAFDEDLATFPERSQIPTAYSPELFEDLLSGLTPKTCCYLLTADPKLSGYSPTKKEKWMDAEYSLVKIDQKSLTAWENTSPEHIFLSPSNPFVPEHLALLPSDNHASILPSLVINTDEAKIHYQRDTLYTVPEVVLTFKIETPLIDGSARSAVLADLFCKSYHEKLHGTLHMASNSGLQGGLSAGHHSLTLSLSGYSEKAPKLASILFAKLKNIEPPQESFAVYKELLLSAYANASKELPFRQGKEILDSLLLTSTPTQREKLEVLSNLSYDEFITFSQELFENASVEGLAYGNLSKEETISLSSQLCKAINAKPLAQNESAKRKVRLLPKEEGPFLVVESTNSLGKAALLAVQQGPFTYESRAKQLITGKLVHELFYDRLRTKQQTAYIALAKDFDLEGQLVQLFVVQSSSHQPQELLARFDLFLDEFNQEFDQLITPERFAKIQTMLVQELSFPPENLQGMARRLAALAFEYNADFAYYPKLIDSVKATTYADIKAFVGETLSRKNTRRLAVLVEGKMPNKREFIYKKTAKEDIASIGDLETRDFR